MLHFSCTNPPSHKEAKLKTHRYHCNFYASKKLRSVLLQKKENNLYMPPPRREMTDRKLLFMSCHLLCKKCLKTQLTRL